MRAIINIEEFEIYTWFKMFKFKVQGSKFKVSGSKFKVQSSRSYCILTLNLEP